jgi:hypothetical protein
LQQGRLESCNGRSIQLSYGCVAVHLADWPGLGNGPAGGWQGEEQGPKGDGHTFESCRVRGGGRGPGVPRVWRVDTKVIRRIAGKIIDFLAQLEDFQKKLWLKKKFVVETQYCITLDRIPEEF